MQPRPLRLPRQGHLPQGMLAIALCLAAGPANAAALAWLPEDLLTTGILALFALGMLGALILSVMAYCRSRRPPAPTVSAAELDELRRSVTAFAHVLREGSAMLLKNQQETLSSVERVAAHSQQLIALIAGCEERMTNATARSEILATRVARSAAVEVKASVESLTAISARIEYQARALEEATRLVGARAA